MLRHTLKKLVVKIANLGLVVSDAFSFNKFYLIKRTENLVEITKFWVVLTNKTLAYINACETTNLILQCIFA